MRPNARLGVHDTNVDFELMTAPFSLADHEKWKRGLLHLEWASKYPFLFDEQDIRLARQDGFRYHFYEWRGAIHLYEQYGYLSLVEQYVFWKKHPCKWQRFCEVLRDHPELIKYMKPGGHPEFGETQPPDLFVYKPDKSEWYLCEVKSPRDRFQPKPLAYFRELERRTGHPLRVLKLFPIP